MADNKSLVERSPLQLASRPTIGEEDRSRIFRAVGKRLDDMINGPASYYREGMKKDPDALIDDLTGFYNGVERFRHQLNDPNSIMGDVLDELKKFNDAFAPTANWSAPGLQRDKAIEMPPKLAPKTQDQNIIEIDPFGGPYAPPQPWQQPRRDLNASVEGSEQALDGRSPNAYRRVSSRLVYPPGREPKSMT